MIRRLQPWELEDALPLARAFHAETGIGGAFCPERFLATIQAPNAVVVGYWHNGTLVGLLAGVIAPHFITTDILAQESMWFCVPDHRGLESLKMFKAFEQWAAEKGATAISMVSLERLSPPSVEKFYLKRGYAKVEAHYLKFLSPNK
jgi:hypothetical protein